MLTLEEVLLDHPKIKDAILKINEDGSIVFKPWNEFIKVFKSVDEGDDEDAKATFIHSISYFLNAGKISEKYIIDNWLPNGFWEFITSYMDAELMFVDVDEVRAVMKRTYDDLNCCHKLEDQINLVSKYRWYQSKDVTDNIPESAKILNGFYDKLLISLEARRRFTNYRFDPYTEKAPYYNPHKRIFKSTAGWLIFSDFREHVKSELADYSFIYHVMIRDGFMYEISPKEYKAWLEKEFEIDLGLQWRQFSGSEPQWKYDIYGNLKRKYEHKNFTDSTV